jgi:hypothetical protein
MAKKTVTVNNVAPDVDAEPDQTGVRRGAMASLCGVWTDPARSADSPYDRSVRLMTNSSQWASSV